MNTSNLNDDGTASGADPNTAQTATDPAVLENWNSRKSVAQTLYEQGNYGAAADVIWGAGELPFLSEEIAFCLKVLARGRNDDAVRLASEVLERNAYSAPQCFALARDCAKEGMPLLAARFYGAAMAVDPAYFQSPFENESLYYDDSKVLVKAWEASGQEGVPASESPMQNFLGKAKSFMEYTQRITQVAPSVQANAASQEKPPSGSVTFHFPNQ